MIAPVKVQWLHANESGLSCFDTLEIERELTDFAPPTQPFPQGNRISKSLDGEGFVLAADCRIDSTRPSNDGGRRPWVVLRPVLRI